MSEQKSDSIFEIACALRASCGLDTPSGYLNGLLIASQQGRIFVLRGIYDAPIGYVLFALITRESLRRLYDYGAYPSYPYELKQGRFCLIIDVVFSQLWSEDARRQLVRWLNSYRVICFSRNNRIRVKVRGARPQLYKKVFALPSQTQHADLTEVDQKIDGSAQ